MYDTSALVFINSDVGLSYCSVGSPVHDELSMYNCIIFGQF